MKPIHQDQHVTIYNADCVEAINAMEAESVQCCVTSPPYWGLRDYKVDGQIGLESTPDEYVAKMVQVFSAVKRVLKDDGTLWLNLGDTYSGGGNGGGGSFAKDRAQFGDKNIPSRSGLLRQPKGTKPKDLIGIPWKVAFALQADGWYLRSDIIWAKPNCMPESVTDRPTRSHEYIFLLSKSERYFYDADAIKEPCSESFLNDPRHKTGGNENNIKIGYESNGAQNPKGPHRLFDKQRGHSRRHAGFNDRLDLMEKEEQLTGMRNKRDVWTVSPASYKDAHFATYPPELIKPCILAGSRAGDVILDPFSGSGTSGEVAIETGRKAILIELNPDYIPLIKTRTMQPGFAL